MIFVVENFLSGEDFAWLNTIAKQKAAFSLELAKSNKPNIASIKFYTENKSSWDYGFTAKNNGLPIAYAVIGKHIEKIINQTIEKIKQHDPNLEPLQTVYFMFAKEGYEIPKHLDIRRISSTTDTLKTIYKAFIFCHEKWEDDWGGELCFNSQAVRPKPNTLIVYSNDELHWVNKVNNIGDNTRMIFGIRCGEE